MKRIFICSAYRDDVARNVEVARAACRYVIAQGHAPLAVHLYLPDVLDDADPDERAQGIECGKAWIPVADEVWAFGAVSDGMRQELDLAARLGKPVRRLP